MDWLEKHINLGAIKEKSTAYMTFKYDDTAEITSIKPSCPGCTSVNYDPILKQLHVEYNPGKLPKHLNGTFYHVTVQKTIQVTYSDGNTDVLSFSAKVTK